MTTETEFPHGPSGPESLPATSPADIERELKELIVSALMLEDVVPEQIETDAPLFGDGLGLDSIDALELSLAIHRRFGVQIEAQEENKREIFGSVRSLAAYVGAHRNG